MLSEKSKLLSWQTFPEIMFHLNSVKWLRIISRKYFLLARNFS